MSKPFELCELSDIAQGEHGHGYVIAGSTELVDACSKMRTPILKCKKKSGDICSSPRQGAWLLQTPWLKRGRVRVRGNPETHPHATWFPRVVFMCIGSRPTRVTAAVSVA